MRLPSKLEPLLRSAIQAYPHEAGRLHWRKERQLMRRLQDKRCFARREVVAIVRWKVTTFTERAVHYVERNDDVSVRSATMDAFLCKGPQEPLER